MMAFMPPSAGPLPTDDSRGPQILIVNWVFLLIGLIIVIIRFITRGVLRKTLGRDDWTILIALAFSICESILAIFLVKNGQGRHIRYLRPIELQTTIKYLLVAITLNTIGTFFVRVSVCFFVLRLVPSTYRVFYRWTWGLMTFFALVTAANFLALCLQCIPLRSLWDMSVKAQCTSAKNTNIIIQVKGAVSILMDVLCVVLPMFFLRNLNASFRDKAWLYAILALGLCTAGAAVGRTAMIKRNSRDLTWDIAPGAIWASLEQNIGIIVASLPALRQFFIVIRQEDKGKNCPAENKCRYRRPQPHLRSRTKKFASHADVEQATSSRVSPQWSTKSPRTSAGASTLVQSEGGNRRSDPGISLMSRAKSPRAGPKEVPEGLNYGTYKCTISGGLSEPEHNKSVRTWPGCSLELPSQRKASSVGLGSLT